MATSVRCAGPATSGTTPRWRASSPRSKPSGSAKRSIAPAMTLAPMSSTTSSGSTIPGLIDGAIRAPQPGAPFAYVTTKTFLEAFGFASLRDLPDLERLKAEGLLQSARGGADLDSALGSVDEEDDMLQDETEPDDAGSV